MFTGSPTDIFWKELFHKVFLRNELGSESNAETAFKMSWAETELSGWSFGYVQWDLGVKKDGKPTNQFGRDVFKDILLNAKDASNNYIVKDLNPFTGRANDSKVLRILESSKIPGGANAGSNSLTIEDITLIDKALKSSYGRSKISSSNDEYLGILLKLSNSIISVPGPDRKSVV